MIDGKTDWKTILWTTIIVAITNVVIWNLFDRVIFNKSIYKTGVAYFSALQPAYFPVLFLLATFIATLVIVWVYQMLLPSLPQNWIVRGLMIGAILFLVIDLPNAVQTAFTTILPMAAARSFFSHGILPTAMTRERKTIGLSEISSVILSAVSMIIR